MLLSHYTWNEEDTANTRDYSTNGNDSTAMIVTGFIAAETGEAVRLDGINDVMTFGDINEGTTNLSIVMKVRIGGTSENPIAFKKDQYIAGTDIGQKAFFKVTIGAAEFEVTSASSVTTGGDYKMVIFTWDGNAASDNGKIYIDATLDANTLTQTGDIDGSTNPFKIGTDDTDFAQTRIETLSVYNQTLTQAQVKAITNRPGGLLIDVTDSSNFAVGDLIELSDKVTTGGQGVLAGIINSTQILYLPITGSIPSAVDIIRRRGNTFDTDRQWIVESAIDGENGVIQIKDRVDNFTIANLANASTVGYKSDRSGTEFMHLISPNFEVFTGALIGQIDDLSSKDIGLATTLYIDGDGSSWTGLLAPSPVRPQLLFIINEGSTDIPVKMEDGGSIAANRFLSNGDVDIKIDEMGEFLYDVTAARWRVSKFT